MSFMISKFRGTYRLRAPYDLSINQFPRDLKGNYSDLDIYIDCTNGIQISYFGQGVLESYIPSLGRGRNIVKAIYSDFVKPIEESKYLTIIEKEDEKTGELKLTNSFDYNGLYHDEELNKLIYDIYDTDEEVLFKFKWDKMKQFEKYLKPKTSAADRSPFSSKNLPKSDYEIPEEDQVKYKMITNKLPKEDILKIGRMTNEYIKTLSNRRNKLETIKDDIKKKCMKNNQYIHSIGKWNDYLKYLESEIDKLC